MSLPAKRFVTFVTGVMIAGAAQAQLLPTWETHITLTQQDLDMIRSTLTNQVHTKPVGTTASWSNPPSGNSATIRLIKKFSIKNQQCEKIEYKRNRKTRPFTPNTIISSAGSTADGIWKIESLRIIGQQDVTPVIDVQPLRADGG